MTKFFLRFFVTSLTICTSLYADWNFIHSYSAKGQTDVIKDYLKEHPENVDQLTSDGTSPLMWAAWKGHEETVEVLLLAGADVNHESLHGNSALILAMQQDNEAVVKRLIKAGAQVNHTNKLGTTALHGAVHYGRKNFLPILIEAGANPYALETGGEKETPVSYAQKYRPDYANEIIMNLYYKFQEKGGSYTHCGK